MKKETKKEIKKETKEFEKLSDGRLLITIDAKDDLALPPVQGKTHGLIIGIQEQLTKQYIDKDKIPMMDNFITNQKTATEGQITNLKVELKKVAYAKTNIPDDIVKALVKSLTKGTKSFKKQTLNLQKYIADLQRKTTLEGNIKYLNKQLEKMNEDYLEIKKYTK